jgi:hypothetical protein
MSTSRRRFLKTGMLTALFAVGPVKTIFSQSWKDQDGNPRDPLAQQNDAFNNYSKAAFRSYLNSTFQLESAFGIVAVTLTQVDDLPSPRNGETFALVFRGGSRALRQGTYVLTHPSMGTFSLLLVPTGADRNGAQGYMATINRLSYGDVLNNPAPSRIVSAKPDRTTTTEPAAAPAVVQPAAPDATAPKDNRKLKRKPTWKSPDQRQVS